MKLGAFTEAEQLDFDGVLAEFRAEAPPEGAREGPKEASMTAIGAELELVGDVSHRKKGTETHLDDGCPFVVECEVRRQRLSTYRQYQPCHWVIWRNTGNCPIYRNGGNGDGKA